jgi:hypothetical protein
MPDDGIEIVKADPPANDTNVGVEGKYEVSSEVASGYTDITDHAHQPSAGDKDTKDMPPNLLHFIQKCLVILDMPQLIGILVVPFEIPVRRRCNNEMDRLIIQEGQIPTPLISL